MLDALILGLIASSAFPIGVALGLAFRIPDRVIASVVAFGAGVLVVALTLELMNEALEEGSVIWALAGLLCGSLIYIVIDQALERAAEKSPKRTGRDPEDVVENAPRKPETEEQAAISGMAVLVGTALDGVPENAAIGVGLAAEQGSQLGLVLLGAVFLSNLPGAVSSTVGMKREGRSSLYIVVAWTLVAIACVGSTVAGYAFLSGLPPEGQGFMMALAAGGILAMLSDTMFPEAFKAGGPWVALASTIGFASAFLLASWTG